MTINGYRFIFANHSSDEFGVFKCTIGSQTNETNDETTNLRLSKNPFKETWDFHGLEYTEPLKFKLTIAKQNGDFINSDEQRELKKWLCKDSFNWLQVEQDDMNNIYYFCILNNPRPVDIGSMTGGYEFDCTCNAPYAFSGLYKKKYTTTNGALTFNFNVFSDYDNYILYPMIAIMPTANGNVQIKNNTTNQMVAIENCITSETIKMDCKNDIIESSNGRILIDKWNKKFLYFVEGKNKLTLTGNFALHIEYRMPIRIGG